MKQDEGTVGIFISHAWNYKDEYYRLEKMLDESPGFRWQNIFPGFAKPGEDSPEELENALKRQIETSEVVLTISDLYVKNPEWIEKELYIARELGKPIIGIRSLSHDALPPEIREYANEVVEWDRYEIMGAIGRNAKKIPCEKHGIQDNSGTITRVAA